jgi:Flp pilus assembly protein CpaB
MFRSACIAAFTALLFAGKSSGEDKPSALPPKHKAFAVKVNPSEAAFGFIRPNSRVDLLVLRKVEDGKVETKLLLENLLVIGVDETATGTEILYQTATILIADKDVPAVKDANKTGEFRLALRAPADKKYPQKQD